MSRLPATGGAIEASTSSTSLLCGVQPIAPVGSASIAGLSTLCPPQSLAALSGDKPGGAAEVDSVGGVVGGEGRAEGVDGSLGGFCLSVREEAADDPHVA